LKIVGIGGESDRLKALAGPNVEFLGRLPDDSILELYRRCRLLVFPGEEDFGIVPVEAQACGRPVVALAAGGALETVKNGVSGILFKEQTEASLLDAIDRAEATDWNPEAIRAQAEQFSEAVFIAGMADSIKKCLA
jgi:glycosyltransferase involved in cell wall biosynthesis